MTRILTGNYAVFHAKLAKPFRDQFGPDRIAEGFKGFREQNVDIDLIGRAGAGSD